VNAALKVEEARWARFFLLRARQIDGDQFRSARIAPGYRYSSYRYSSYAAMRFRIVR
jgi:hypothetical protein